MEGTIWTGRIYLALLVIALGLWLTHFAGYLP